MRIAACDCCAPGSGHALAQYARSRALRTMSAQPALRVSRKRRQDPTQTTMVRWAFEREVNRRFAELRRLVQAAVVDNDVLGLASSPGPRVHVEIPRPGAFAFSRTDRKISSFMEWLRLAAQDNILDVRLGVPMARAAETAWSNVYIQSAYQRGLAQAANELRGQGVSVSDRYIDGAFLRPFHVDRAGIAFTRTFDELRGVTEAMDQQISRVLAQGLVEGRGPMDIARSLNDRVDKIGRTRARTIARTEVISAHAEATLNTYDEAGVLGVRVMAELATAQDDAVCEECMALETQTAAGPISIDDARGLIPVHPNCRCAILPVVMDPSGARLD